MCGVVILLIYFAFIGMELSSIFIYYMETRDCYREVGWYMIYAHTMFFISILFMCINSIVSRTVAIGIILSCMYSYCLSVWNTWLNRLYTLHCITLYLQPVIFCTHVCGFFLLFLASFPIINELVKSNGVQFRKRRKDGLAKKKIVDMYNPKNSLMIDSISTDKYLKDMIQKIGLLQGELEVFKKEFSFVAGSETRREIDKYTRCIMCFGLLDPPNCKRYYLLPNCGHAYHDTCFEDKFKCGDWKETNDLDCAVCGSNVRKEAYKYIHGRMIEL